MHFPLLALALATLTLASPLMVEQRSDGGSCAAAGGAQNCCAHKFDVNPKDPDSIKKLTAPGGILTDILDLDLAGILKDTTAQVGVDCSVISLPSCQGANVCCGNSQTVQSSAPAAGLLGLPLLQNAPINVCGIVVPVNVL